MSATKDHLGTARQIVPLRPLQALDEANRLPCGALDGLTIMRYAHMYRDRASGGVEQYLRLLNRGLLERSRAVILQMYLARDGEADEIEEEVGLGRIIWVPVLRLQIDSRVTGLLGGVASAYGRVRDCRRGTSGARPGATIPFLHSVARHCGALLRYKRAIFSDRMAGLLAMHRVDLLALHWFRYD